MASAKNINRQLWPELYHAFPNKTVRSIGKVQCHRWRMAGDSGTGGEEYQYAAYVPIRRMSESPYSTITSAEGGGFIGQLGSERLTPQLEALPVMSQERWDQVHAFIARNHEQAYQTIIDAYPEAASGRQTGGRISVVLRNRVHTCNLEYYSSEIHEHVSVR